MKRLLLLLFLPLCAHLFGAEPVDHHFSFEVDYLWMKRRNVERHSIVNRETGTSITPISGPAPVATTAVDPVSVINTKHLVKDMHGVSGYRLIGTYIHDQVHSLQARFYSQIEWQGKEQVNGVADLFFPFKPNSTADYRRADKAQTQYNSRMFSTDLSYWLHISPRRVSYFAIGWNIGPRYIQIDERFSASFTKQGGESHYVIDTWNKLWGAQSGGTIELNPFKRLTWGLSLRVGGYGNAVQKHTKLKDVNNSITRRNISRKQTMFSYSYEFSPYLLYYFFDHFMIRASYEWLFVNDLVLAPEQIGFTRPKTGMHRSGSARYETLIVGLAVEF